MEHTIYAIGDIQGCYDEFIRLLKAIDFTPSKHKLWIAGDLVNRGPKSLKTLRHIKKLNEQGAADIVLGNHDLHLIAAAEGHRHLHPSDTIQKILKAKDSPALIEWLCQQPLMQYDETSGFAMTHAGISPQWSIDEAWNYALEVERQLQKPKKRRRLLAHMYGNEPSLWDDSLSGMERYRYIINAFTRMRYVDKKTGELDLKEKNKLGQQAKHLCPWYKSKLRQHNNTPIVFGHWASLELKAAVSKKYKAFHIDHGCVWGKQLSAINLSTLELTQINSRFSAF